MWPDDETDMFWDCACMWTCDVIAIHFVSLVVSCHCTLLAWSTPMLLLVPFATSAAHHPITRVSSTVYTYRWCVNWSQSNHRPHPSSVRFRVLFDLASHAGPIALPRFKWFQLLLLHSHFRPLPNCIFQCGMLLCCTLIIWFCLGLNKHTTQPCSFSLHHSLAAQSIPVVVVVAGTLLAINIRATNLATSLNRICHHSHYVVWVLDVLANWRIAPLVDSALVQMWSAIIARATLMSGCCQRVAIELYPRHVPCHPNEAKL